MREVTYRDAVREAMCEEMRRDESVYFMGEDIGAYCGAFGVSKGMLSAMTRSSIKRQKCTLCSRERFRFPWSSERPQAAAPAPPPSTPSLWSRCTVMSRV